MTSQDPVAAMTASEVEALVLQYGQSAAWSLESPLTKERRKAVLAAVRAVVVRADAAEREAQGLRGALEPLIAATEMPTYVSLQNWEYPSKTYVQSYGGGDCSKHGRYYGTCVCCKHDYDKAQSDTNREARYQRDEAIRAAVKKAKAALAEGGKG